MRTLDIAGRSIAPLALPLIIAEIGNNHDGSMEQALRLIEAAAGAGADAVKFQTYTADSLVRPDHELRDFFARFQLPRQWHEQLQSAAHDRGMLFLSTPFDLEAVEFLDSLGVPAFKIASSDLTNLPLIRRCADTGKPLLISTGMGTLEETGTAVEAARMKDNHHLALMHCVSIYPTPIEATQIDAIHEMGRLFDLPIGFSDHSLSTTLPTAAVALGARIIEKHFTLSRSLPGPDHAVALEPAEFALMARGCREVVTSFAASAGKQLTPAIERVRSASLRGLYARVDIPAGTVLADEHFIPLRPAAELTISDLPDVLGRTTLQAIPRGEAISRKHLL